MQSIPHEAHITTERMVQQKVEYESLGGSSNRRIYSLLLWPCDPCHSYRKDTTRADHGKTNKSYYPNNGRSLKAKASRPCSSQEGGWKRNTMSLDRGNGTRELPALQPGDWVRVKLDSEKQWTTESKVTSKDQSPRSYIVDSGGRMLRRNRKHLIKVSTPTCHDTPKDNFRFQQSVSLLPKISKQRIPKFRKTATPVQRAIITQSRNRGPPVED